MKFNLPLKPIVPEYTVSYNGNSATSGSMTSDSARYNKNYTAKENTFIKEGYEFVGWNTAADGSGDSWKAKEHVSIHINMILRYMHNGHLSRIP